MNIIPSPSLLPPSSSQWNRLWPIWKRRFGQIARALSELPNGNARLEHAEGILHAQLGGFITATNLSIRIQFPRCTRPRAIFSTLPGARANTFPLRFHVRLYSLSLVYRSVCVPSKDDIPMPPWCSGGWEAPIFLPPFAEDTCEVTRAFLVHRSFLRDRRWL